MGMEQRVYLERFNFSVGKSEIEGFHQVWGKPGLKALAYPYARGKTYHLDPEEIASRYAKGASEVYGPHSSFVSLIGVANSAVRQLQEAFSHEDRPGLNNDVDWLPGPAEALQLLHARHQDPKFTLEITRGIFLSHIAGLLARANGYSEARIEIGKLHRSFTDRKLYIGLDGHTYPYTFSTYHDPETGTVKAISPDSGDPSTDFVRNNRLFVRNVKGIGPVHVSPREKDQGRALLKAIDKARGTGRFIDPLEAVQDGAGIMFVVMRGGQDNVDKLAELLRERLLDYPGLTGEPRQDDLVGNDHGQSQEVRFRRWKVPLKGLATDVEIIICDGEEYTNSLYEIGRKDAQTNLMNGRAHRMFIDRRNIRIATNLFPSEIYSDPLKKYKFDPVESIIRQNEQEAARLRVADVVNFH